MITIHMKKDANWRKAECVAMYLHRQGHPVQVKGSGGHFVVVVLGEEADKIDFCLFDRFSGIDRIERDSDYYLENHQEFDEAWSFFSVL